MSTQRRRKRTPFTARRSSRQSSTTLPRVQRRLCTIHESQHPTLLASGSVPVASNTRSSKSSACWTVFNFLSWADRRFWKCCRCRLRLKIRKCWDVLPADTANHARRAHIGWVSGMKESQQSCKWCGRTYTPPGTHTHTHTEREREREKAMRPIRYKNHRSETSRINAKVPSDR